MLASAAGFLYLNLYILPATPIFRGVDQWLFLSQGARVAAGELPYRDFFELLGPGMDVLDSVIITALGARIFIPNLLLLMIGVVLAWLTYDIARRILPGYWPALPALLFVTLGFRLGLDASHHWPSVLFSLSAAVVLMGGRSPQRAACAGALCGLAALFTQSRGAAVLAALAAYLAWKGWRGGLTGREILRQETVLVGAAAAVFLAGISYFVWKAGFATVFNSVVVFPARYYGSANPPSVFWQDLGPPQEWTRVPTWLAVLLLHLMPLVYPAVLLRWVRDRGSRNLPGADAAMLLCFVGVALNLEIANFANGLRLAAVSAPGFVLGCWLLLNAGRPGRVALGAVAALALVFAIPGPIALQRSVAGTMMLPAGRAAFLDRRLLDSCREVAERVPPGATFFGDTTCDFPLALKSPARIALVTTTDFTRPEQVTELISTLRDQQVQWLAIEDTMEPTSSPGDHLQPLRDYVRQHYHRVSPLMRELNR